MHFGFARHFTHILTCAAVVSIGLCLSSDLLLTRAEAADGAKAAREQQPAAAHADDAEVCSNPDAAPAVVIDACTRWLSAHSKRGSDAARAYARIGDAQNKDKHPDQAVESYAAALEAGPSRNTEAYVYHARGQLWHNKREYIRAYADYSRAVELDPKSPVYANDRGMLRMQQKDYDGAIADFDRLMQMDWNKKSWTLAMRGWCKLKKGETDKAIDDFDKAIKADPKEVFAIVNRGVAWRTKGDLSRAMRDFDTAVEVEGTSYVARTERGQLLILAGRLDDAFADFNMAIDRQPDYGMAYAQRGLAYEKKGDRDMARRDFAKVLSLQGHFIDSDLALDIARTHLPAAEMVTTPAAAVEKPAAGEKHALPQGPRVALVIGNSGYEHFPRIPNPLNDATDLAKSLESLGFEVILGTDLKRSDMEEAFVKFARKARSAETALVYYAGHGLQHNGVNYLAPIDAKIEDETDLRKLISLQDVIADLQNAGRVRILIVDACRDNQVIQQLSAKLPQSRSTAFQRGLAAVSGADGTLISFATQANRVAADGTGRNSPFAQSLLKNLPTPGLELRTMMARVRGEVVAATNGSQRPEVWDSLVGEFEFVEASR